MHQREAECGATISDTQVLQTLEESALQNMQDFGAQKIANRATHYGEAEVHSDRPSQFQKKEVQVVLFQSSLSGICRG